MDGAIGEQFLHHCSIFSLSGAATKGGGLKVILFKTPGPSVRPPSFMHEINILNMGCN